MELMWLIWSNEHGAWWAPGRFGYVDSREEAGRYRFNEAVSIVDDANLAQRATAMPNEALVPDAGGADAARIWRLECQTRLYKAETWARETLAEDDPACVAICDIARAWRAYMQALGGQ